MKDIFERTEKKYVLSEEQYDALSEGLSKHLKEDEYGLQTITNIYFDTEDFELIRHSLEKPEYKEKLRIRCYGVPTLESEAYFEIKKKYEGVVYKRRVSMPLSEIYDSIEKRKVEGDSITKKEISEFLLKYNPEPRYVICYERVALYDPLSSLRMTFDTNIRSRSYDLRLEFGDYGEQLSEDKLYVMEIKAQGGMPLWLADLLNRCKIFPSSFSKYGKIYTKYQIEQIRKAI